MYRHTLAGIKVLCVDDQQVSLGILAAVLKHNGALVTSCRSAEEALREVAAKRFDVIVSDLSMPPGMDGYDLAHALRSLESKAGLVATPTVAVSSDADAPSPKRHFADFQVYMQKPFDHRRLVHIVGRLAEADSAAVRLGTLARWEADTSFQEHARATSEP